MHFPFFKGNWTVFTVFQSLSQFGLSWEIVPSVIGELMSNPGKAPRVMNEILKMRKIDLERLLKA